MFDLHQTREYSEERLKLQSSQLRSNEALSVCRDEKATLEMSVERAEAACEARKQRMESSVQSATTEAQALQESMKKLRSTGANSRAESDHRLRTVQAEVADLSARIEQEKADVQRALLAALDVIMGHKQQVQEMVEQSSAAIESIARDIESYS